MCIMITEMNCLQGILGSSSTHLELDGNKEFALDLNTNKKCLLFTLYRSYLGNLAERC